MSYTILDKVTNEHKLLFGEMVVKSDEYKIALDTLIEALQVNVPTDKPFYDTLGVDIRDD